MEDIKRRFRAHTGDVAVIGASGGGLAAGISLALKARAPEASRSTPPSPKASTTPRARSAPASTSTISGSPRHDLRCA